MLRLIWSLVIACVVAATGVRPELERQLTDARDPASAAVAGSSAGQLHRAPGPAPISAIRATSVRTPDVRLPAFILPTPPQLPAVVRARTYTSPGDLASAFSSSPCSQSARGPPSSIV